MSDPAKFNDNYAIKVNNVSKHFLLPHERSNSVKALFLSLFKTRRAYELQHALQDINFEVKQGEFFGVIGRNGSGKSTLLKILAGIYQPSKGHVQTKGRVVPFIELGVGFNGELTGKENVFLNGALLGFSHKEISKKYYSIVKFAELERFMDQKLKNYSSGMQVRLAFSVATILADSDILLIDEVLAVGDAAFQKKCLDYFRELKRKGKTVMFVSHDMNAIQQYCDRVLMIEKSKVVAVDRPAIVASKYHRLFSEEALAKEATAKKKDPAKTGISGEERWGDKSAEILSVEAIVQNPSNKDGEGVVIVRVKVQARKSLAKPIIGFSIKNAYLAQLLGTNTKRLNQSIPPLSAGQTVDLEWSVDNMFNEGTYYVDSTVAYDDATNVADRWPDATEFNIYREDNTPYQVYPNIKVTILG